MTIEQIKQLVAGPDYDFLRTDPHLGDRIMFLTLGGSYSYGTNTETSDIDIRGCTMNNAKENTSLPAHPDLKRVEEFVMEVNKNALGV